VTDGPGRRVLKAIALGHFYLNVWTHRALQRVRGRRSHLLVGECRRSARCCEAPSVRANAAVWYLRSLRGLFLGWMKHVNGFDLESVDRSSRTFVFRCTHFDRETRSCDSYISRPGMWFAECGYGVRPANAGALAAALDRHALSPDQRQKLRRELDLE